MVLVLERQELLYTYLNILTVEQHKQSEGQLKHQCLEWLQLQKEII
jgi:hypothetical protein